MTTKPPWKPNPTQRAVLLVLARANAPALFNDDIHRACPTIPPRTINAALVNLERRGAVASKASGTDPLARTHFLITKYGRDLVKRTARTIQLDAFS